MLTIYIFQDSKVRRLQLHINVCDMSVEWHDTRAMYRPYCVDDMQYIGVYSL